MKKLLSLILVAFMLCGCANASADVDSTPYVDETISVKEGYYLNDVDDSYIIVLGNTIQHKNINKENVVEKWYKEDVENGLIKSDEYSLDAYIADNLPIYEVDESIKSFTPMFFPSTDTTMLVTASSSGGEDSWSSYEGFILKDENTIYRTFDYVYYGESLPANISE